MQYKFAVKAIQKRQGIEATIKVVNTISRHNFKDKLTFAFSRAPIWAKQRLPRLFKRCFSTIQQDEMRFSFVCLSSVSILIVVEQKQQKLSLNILSLLASFICPRKTSWIKRKTKQKVHFSSYTCLRPFYTVSTIVSTFRMDTKKPTLFVYNSAYLFHTTSVCPFMQPILKENSRKDNGKIRQKPSKNLFCFVVIHICYDSLASQLFVLLSCVVRIDCFCYFSSSTTAVVYHHHHRQHHQSCELSDPLYNKRRKKGEKLRKLEIVGSKKSVYLQTFTHIFSLNVC